MKLIYAHYDLNRKYMAEFAELSELTEFELHVHLFQR